MVLNRKIMNNKLKGFGRKLCHILKYGGRNEVKYEIKPVRISIQT